MKPALFLVAAQLAWAARFGLEHPGQVTRVTDPQLSPDGRTIAVLVGRANYDDNRFDTDLVLVDVATKAQRTLTRGRAGVTQPRWSPDGSRLAFLATSEGKPQVFVMPMMGGDSLLLTRVTGGVQQYAWRPGSADIAYVTQDDAPKLTGEERHNRSFEIQHNHFLMQEAPRPSHVWLVAAAGGKPKRLTQGAWTLPVSLPPSAPSSPLAWSPDGQKLAIVTVATPYTGDGDQSVVQVLDVTTGALTAVTGRAKNESQPLFSPDGRRLAHWYPRDGDSKNVNEIYVGPSSGGQSASITRTLDRNVQRAMWMPDGQAMLVSANHGTGVGLWVQPLDGAPKRIDTGRVVPTAAFWLDASMGPKGELAFTGSEPGRPAEVYYLPTVTAKLERLTEFNASIAALELGATESLRWKSEKFECDGVVTYPPGFSASGKYPLVLYIHGGPRSASKEAFSSRAQLMAAKGWVVFEPNYRGSDNLGNEFQAAIWNDAGAGPGRDVMAGVAELEKRGWVDRGKMAVSGWSYGGYMTTWLLGNYPERWKAAVAGAAVTDWLDQYNLGDANVRRGSAFGGSPWTDSRRMEEYRSQSPITYASRIKAPTLVLSNTGDYRVPVTQSYELYHVLRDHGVATQFIGYPLGGHSPSDPVHMRDVDRRWLAWLGKYLD